MSFWLDNVMAHMPLNCLITGEQEGSGDPKCEASHGPYPLTHAQEALWFVEQLRPGTPTYNLPEAFVLKGSLDPVALRRSLDQMVGRHETLRTFFTSEDGRPNQRILANAQFPFKFHDLTQNRLGTPGLQELLRQEAIRPFDLGRAPLASATLFRTSPGEHVLLLNAHHIVSDAWSQGVVIRELFEIYNATVNGVSPRLAELTVQYADFALWQRELIGSDFGIRHLGYWQNRFKTPPE